MAEKNIAVEEEKTQVAMKELIKRLSSNKSIVSHSDSLPLPSIESLDSSEIFPDKPSKRSYISEVSNLNLSANKTKVEHG